VTFEDDIPDNKGYGSDNNCRNDVFELRIKTEFFFKAFYQGEGDGYQKQTQICEMQDFHRSNNVH
jgi:hypothetical protein